MTSIAPVSPGEMLQEEFLKQLGLPPYRVAKDIEVPAPPRLRHFVGQARHNR